MCPSKADEFNKILISKISEVLDFSDVILNFLELNSSFKRGEIMKNADALSNGIRELFGDSRAIIEDIIVKRIYEKRNIPSERNSGTFDEKLHRAYESFNEKNKISI